jgi:hypothetical protein
MFLYLAATCPSVSQYENCWYNIKAINYTSRKQLRFHKLVIMCESTVVKPAIIYNCIIARATIFTSLPNYTEATEWSPMALLTLHPFLVITSSQVTSGNNVIIPTGNKCLARGNWKGTQQSASSTVIPYIHGTSFRGLSIVTHLDISCRNRYPLWNTQTPTTMNGSVVFTSFS